MSISDRYNDGLVIRLFRQGLKSLEFEVGDEAATTTRCATFIKKGIPIALMRNAPGFQSIGRFGFIYDPEEIEVRRAFKCDIFSKFGVNCDTLTDVTIDGKKKVHVPSSLGGSYTYRRDYESIEGIAEKVTRMYAKYKEKLAHNELHMRAKDPTHHTRRIIGVLVDKEIYKNTAHLAEITAFVLKKLPGRSFCIYHEEEGEIEEIPLPTVLSKLMEKVKERIEAELKVLQEMKSKL